jgi:hypothetical protein
MPTMPTPDKARASDSTTHSVRCSDRAWDQARKRAEADGWSMNRAVCEFIEGYGSYKIDLPQIVRVYRTADDI